MSLEAPALYQDSSLGWRPGLNERSDEQLMLANELLWTIPERYRISENGRPLRRIRRPTIQEMNDLDPSESIRSEEIMAATERYFDVVERRDYGGTLLHLVTSAGTIRHYDPGNGEDMALLQRMVDFEKRHIAAGNISSDFALVVARNPKEGSNS